MVPAVVVVMMVVVALGSRNSCELSVWQVVAKLGQLCYRLGLGLESLCRRLWILVTLLIN